MSEKAEQDKKVCKNSTIYFWSHFLKKKPLSDESGF